MFYVKIVDTDGRTWTWVGPFWIFTKGAEADAAAAMQAKTWKTRRGAEAFIAKLERDGHLELEVTETIQIVKV